MFLDEGLDELESEFNSGKIMYAFVKIDDPNTNLKKFVLIVWVSEVALPSRVNFAHILHFFYCQSP